jgi:class 3 adenylate cyclase
MPDHGAIVFTDIVGFTALTDMHGDDVALALLERQEAMVRAALPVAARVVKELGDGLLLWFDDPRDAIDTCLRLQHEFDAVNDAADASAGQSNAVAPSASARGLARPHDNRAPSASARGLARPHDNMAPSASARGLARPHDIPLWVRMGVHWGAPRRRGDDIVGRDVNLAARIVDLAGPGEVLCSGATADAIGTRSGFGFEPLGPVYVRGITDPVPIVRVLADCAPEPAAPVLRE